MIEPVSSSFHRIRILILTGCFFLSFASSANLKVLVVGAGPAGLAAAIAARLQGADVDLFEKRSDPARVGESTSGAWASRKRVVLIDDVSFQIFNELGVMNSPAADLTRLNFLYGRNGALMSDFSSGHGLDFVSNYIYPGRRIAGTAQIQSIELALLERFKQIGGRIHFGTGLESADQAKKYDYVVVADGANSTSSKIFGFSKRDLGFDSSQWVVGTFELSETLRDAEAVWDTRVVAGSPFITLALRHENRVTVYGSAENAVDWSSDEIARHLSERLRIRGNLLDSQSFEVLPESADSYIRDRVLLIGDAARKTDPSTGYGVTLALEDSRRVARFFLQIRRGESSVAVREFSREMTQATDRTAKQVKWATFMKKLLASQRGSQAFRVGFPILNAIFGIKPLDCSDLLKQDRTVFSQ